MQAKRINVINNTNYKSPNIQNQKSSYTTNMKSNNVGDTVSFGANMPIVMGMDTETEKTNI